MLAGTGGLLVLQRLGVGGGLAELGAGDLTGASGGGAAVLGDGAGDEHADDGADHGGRKNAVDWLAGQVVKVTDGTWIDPAAGKRTFDEWVALWLDDQVQHRPTTMENTRRRIANHLQPTFGTTPLVAIRRGEVQAWVRTLTTKGLAPAYVEALYRLLSQILAAAVADGKLSSSPCSDVNLPPVVRSRIRIPTTVEVAAIATALPEDWADVVLAVAGSGLRLGEAHGLAVDRVNFLRSTITVDRQLHYTGRAPSFGPPKTAAGERTIPVAREVIELIEQRLERVGLREQHVGGERVQLVFTTSDGLPWPRHRWRNTWAYWVPGKLGLPTRFHDLRHLYASALIAAGQSPKVVQERLGHARISETFDTYGHLWPSDDEGTRTATGPLVAEICGLLADRTA